MYSYMYMLLYILVYMGVMICIVYYKHYLHIYYAEYSGYIPGIQPGRCCCRKREKVMKFKENCEFPIDYFFICDRIDNRKRDMASPEIMKR